MPVNRKRWGGMVVAAASALGPMALSSLPPLLLHAAVQQSSHPRALPGMHAFAADRRARDAAVASFERDLQLALAPTGSEELPREIQLHCPGFRKLTADELRRLMRRLQAAPQHHVISLDLGGHSMGVMMRELAEPIAALKALQVLMLSGNDIGDSGCTSVAGALPHLSALQVLHLRENKIGDSGCTAVAGALQHLSALQVLNIAGNNTTVAGVCRLVPSLLFLLDKPQLSGAYLDHLPSECLGHDAWKGAGLPAPPHEVVAEGWKTTLRFIRFHDSMSPVLAAASALVVFSRCSMHARAVQRHALLGTMVSQRSTGPVSLQRKLYPGNKRPQLLCCGGPLSALLRRLATVVDHSGRTGTQHTLVVCIMKRCLSGVARRLWSTCMQ